jgi:subtilisin family serine protease
MRAAITLGANPSFPFEDIDSLNKVFGVDSVFQTIVLPEVEGRSMSQQSEIEARHQEYGFDLWYTLSYDILRKTIDDVVAAYATSDYIEVVEPVMRAYPLFTPDDPQYTYISETFELWDLKNTGKIPGSVIDMDMDADQAWDIEGGDPSVKIGVVDYGIDFAHEDVGNFDSESSYDFCHGDETIDWGNHGNMVSGSINAMNNNGIGISSIAGGTGISDGVTIVSYQVLNGDINYLNDNANPCTGGVDFPFIWRTAADNGIAIINMSFSSGGYSSYGADAIKYFNEYGGGDVMDGGIIVYASGNGDTEKTDTMNWFPASSALVIASGGIREDGIKHEQTNYGTWLDVLAAEQTKTLATSPITEEHSYITGAGTSNAAPHVCGVLGLIISAHPGRYSREEVIDILLRGCVDVDSYNSGLEGKLGAGFINAYHSLLLTQTPSPVASFTTDIRRTTIGTTISFTGSSTNSPYTWKWTITPNTFSYVGGTTSASQNPKIQCTANGLYTASLYVFNGGDSDTYTRVNYLTITDIAYITGNTIMFSK